MCKWRERLAVSNFNWDGVVADREATGEEIMWVLKCTMNYYDGLMFHDVHIKCVDTCKNITNSIPPFVWLKSHVAVGHGRFRQF